MKTFQVVLSQTRNFNLVIEVKATDDFEAERVAMDLVEHSSFDWEEGDSEGMYVSWLEEVEEEDNT